MNTVSKPNLGWIDIDDVVQIALKRFTKSVKKANLDVAAQVEPTLAVFRSAITGIRLDDSTSIDRAVSLTKTVQNAVGLFHQDLLGSAAGWTSTGSGSGVVDLKGTSRVDGKAIVAEVKMRHNTIKGSAEGAAWQTLKDSALLTGRGTVAYLFQIVPKTPAPYDRPWKVSNHTPSELVRVADGVTAYHIVTGRASAYFDLINALPYVARAFVGEAGGNSELATHALSSAHESLSEIVGECMPTKSAHA